MTLYHFLFDMSMAYSPWSSSKAGSRSLSWNSASVTFCSSRAAYSLPFLVRRDRIAIDHEHIAREDASSVPFWANKKASLGPRTIDAPWTRSWKSTSGLCSSYFGSHIFVA